MTIMFISVFQSSNLIETGPQEDKILLVVETFVPPELRIYTTSHIHRQPIKLMGFIAPSLLAPSAGTNAKRY